MLGLRPVSALLQHAFLRLMNQMRPPSRQAPGCSKRPELSAEEAEAFTPARFFARGGLLAAPDGPWQPDPIDCTRADFSVGPGGSHATLQSAINAAITAAREDGAARRRFIRILPGRHAGAVYIPADAPPLTLYGAGKAPDEVSLELCLDSRMSVAEYCRRVNPAQQFRPGDPAWTMYQATADRPADECIDTPAAAVFWSQAADLQLANFSIVNTLLDTVDACTHQAVALRCDGDRTQLQRLRLIGRQDTFFCNCGEAARADNKLGAYPVDRIARVHVRDCYVEGDTDYVFGRASAVFEDCEFRSVSSRRHKPAIVFAPSTLPGIGLGFLALNCRFSGDALLQQSGDSFLGRSWDQGAGNSAYQPGLSPNGQLLIRDSHIDASYSASQPWDCAATTRRPHRGNADPARDLNDPAFNRLWEFNNRGPGAAALS